MDIVRRAPLYLAEWCLGEMSLYRDLKQSEGLDREEVLGLQRKRLARLLRHSFQHVPYYRRILKEAGVVNESGEVSLQMFNRIRPLDKKALREEFEGLKSDDLASRKWFVSSSGGSTGEPVRFILEKRCGRWIRAVKILFDSWTGYPLGARKALLWGSERDLFVGKETFKVHLKRWLKNELWLNAFRMTAADMRRHVRQLNEFKPAHIEAYAASMWELARFIQREGLEVHSPSTIMTSAGILYPQMREAIEQCFGAPVFNRYGTREVGDIACQCEQRKGLHVSELTHYVEIVRSDGTPAPPGEVGHLFVTYLVNYAMPLIRYRIGDMAAWSEEPCSCHRAWALVQEVAGRVTDVFVTRDHDVVTPEYLIHLVGVVLNTGWIRKYQVVQEDYDRITILIAPTDPAYVGSGQCSKSMKEIAEKVRLVMGAECRVDFDFVDDIAPTVSGKYRYTISRVLERERGKGD